MISLRRMALALMLAATAYASGPRYVTGPPYFTVQGGRPIGWKQPTLRYSTDPADLSASVDHAAADALVDAAAAAWNLPVASITLARGAGLAEHVSGQNTYLDVSGMVFPADVMPANAAAVPLAVIYDSDGSVTDTLLGSGASSPSACHANAVTESVDGFDPSGYITHALIIVNGRCTGPSAEKQLELRYKLTRIFGRVLGLAWSQANDNVFTGSPTPTYTQALHWPLLHPIDILCGPYAYQCLPNPFTPRPDDIASLVLLYPNQDGSTLAAAKQPSLRNANAMQGSVFFPNGMGMAGVNVVLHRQPTFTTQTDDFVEASAVSGTTYRRGVLSPFVTAPTDALSSMGDGGGDQIGVYRVAYVPILENNYWDTLIVSTEPVNPLYRRTLSLGPYGPGNVSPAGSAPMPRSALGVGAGSSGFEDFTMVDAPSLCGDGADGTAAAPAQVPTSGWWQGTLCSLAHASYYAFDTKPDRTFTLETTALGADGLATTSKAMPVIALFAPNDQWWDRPSLGLTPAAFQALAAATTTITANTSSTAGRQRVGVADQRGDGRPDFAYQARVFYADTVEPARLSPAGGVVTITGLGFRPGNGVLVNGVPAKVSTWTPTSMLVTLPAMAAAHAAAGTAVDLQVIDRGTGASSTITGAITYDPNPTLPNALLLLSAPTGNQRAGSTSTTPFSVRLVSHDGVTPVNGSVITFAVSAGRARYDACNAATCALTTDANGVASSSVTGFGSGIITLTATAGALTQDASFIAQADGASMIVLDQPPANVNVGEAQNEAFVVRLLAADGSGIPFRPVTFTVPTGSAIFNACFASTCTATTDNAGSAFARITPTGPGAITLQAAATGLVQQVHLTATQQNDTLVIENSPNPKVFLNEYSSVFAVRLLRPDGSGDYGRPVTFTAPDGVSITNCNASTCQLNTNSGGQVGSPILSGKPGTFTIRVSYGTAFVTAIIEVTARTRSIRIVSAPTGSLPINAVAAVPFSAEVIDFDGVTRITGTSATLSGPNDSVRLDACGTGQCVVNFDGQGIVTTHVTPLKPGVITLNAAFLDLVATASFTATAPDAPDTLAVVTQPGAASIFVGDPQTISLRLLKADGTTADAGKTVTVTVTDGAFVLSECGGATCSAVTDSMGVVSFHGVATAAGNIALLGSYAGLSQTIHFTAVNKPNLLRLITAPSGQVTTNEPAAIPFTVRVLRADGTTPVTGQTVTISVSQGSVRFSACAQSSCALLTDAGGNVATTVTPLGAGAITLQASDGVTMVNANFTAVDRPNQLVLVSEPADGAWVGEAASVAFAVRLVKADGVTPVSSQTISIDSGHTATFDACNASACNLTTDASGLVRSIVTPIQEGVIPLTATMGSVIQRVTFNAARRADLLTILSSPANGALVGDTATPALTVSLTSANGTTPRVLQTVTISVTAGAATLTACGNSQCVLTTDQQGKVSTGVLPTGAGNVTIRAVAGALSATAGFTAVARANLLQLVSIPADGAWVDEAAAAAFAVRLVKADGVTPLSGQAILLTSTNGAILNACGSTTCGLTTDGNGVARSTLTPRASGVTLLSAASGTLMQSASFVARSRADLLQVVSAPANGSLVGGPAAIPFALRLTAADGTTPRGNQAVILAILQGSGMLDACRQATCTLTTDARGMVATTVTPTAAGAITLHAADASLTADAAFTAIDPPSPPPTKPDTLTLVSAPAGSFVMGDTVQTLFAVRAASGAGVAIVGRVITFSITGGAATLSACKASSCTVMTDGHGVAAVAITPVAAGAIIVVATDTQTALTARFVATPRPAVLAMTAREPAIYIAEDTGFRLPLHGMVTNDGSAAANVGVVWSGGAGMLPDAAQTSTDSQGVATVTALLGPLAAGGQAAAKACVGSTCASFTATAVAAADFQLALVAGGAQQAAGIYDAVTMIVTDAALHPVAGVPVTIYQTVTALAAACPRTGRCPAAPVLASRMAVMVTDVAGRIGFNPISTGDAPSQTRVTAVAGTFSEITTILTHHP